MGILSVHEVHLQNMEHLQKKNFVALGYEEKSFRREERKSSSKVLKVKMKEYDGSNNYDGSTNDEVFLMSKMLDQSLKPLVFSFGLTILQCLTYLIDEAFVLNVLD